MFLLLRDEKLQFTDYSEKNADDQNKPTVAENKNSSKKRKNKKKKSAGTESEVRSNEQNGISFFQNLKFEISNLKSKIFTDPKPAILKLAKFCAVPFVLGVSTLIYNKVRFQSFTDFGYARIPGVLDEPWYNHGIFSRLVYSRSGLRNASQTVGNFCKFSVSRARSVQQFYLVEQSVSFSASTAQDAR